MTYHFLNGVTKDKNPRRNLWITLSVLGVLIGGYILATALWPALPPTALTSGETTSDRLVSNSPGQAGDRLYIPQINVDVAIAQGDETALEQGAWWRKPENGNPKDGGNFVLSAHRFQLGVTPQQTRANSPFYHIDKLQVDDEIFVDYDGVRYAYRVTNKYQVPPDATEIEQRSEEPKLTIYSCDLRGEAAGREVIEAEPIGTVSWNEDPQIVPLHSSATSHSDAALWNEDLD